MKRLGKILCFGLKSLMKLVLTPVVLLCAVWVGGMCFCFSAKDFLVDMYLHEQMPWD